MATAPPDKAKLDADFAELYKAHLKDVYSYAYYRVGNHHDAEDLTEQHPVLLGVLARKQGARHAVDAYLHHLDVATPIRPARGKDHPLLVALMQRFLSGEG